MLYIIVHVTQSWYSNIGGKKRKKKTAIPYKVEICFHEHEHDQNFIFFSFKDKC